MLSIIINGTDEIDIPKENIKYTLQNNDIADLESRQCNYTNSFSVPKTFKNVQTFKQLGLVGDVSKLPYQKVTATLTDNGVPLIVNGWLDIRETTNEYKLNIRDGSIDLFKAIENKTFGEHTDLSEINHTKDLNTVINSFTNQYYRYIINDYGGKTHTDNGTKINIDYLIPSVNVKYLWNKIFTTFCFNYVGDIFNHLDFTGLWLTYPKGNSIAEIQTINYADLKSIFPGISFLQSNNTVSGSYRQWNILNTVTAGTLVGNFSYLVPETTTYKLKFKANGTTRYRVRKTDGWLMQDSDPTPYRLSIRINGNDTFYFYSDNIDHEITLNLSSGDVIDYEISTAQENELLWPGYIIFNFFEFLYLDEITLKIEKYDTSISFTEELKNLKITDFLKEILNRFALTIFVDKDNNYIFKTFNERLQSGVINWSDKFKERTSETYTPKNYAQINYFKHKYNDENSSYNNGSFLIDNKNLKDNTDVLQSFIYSPEKEIENFFINNSHSENIFPTLLWQKEISENTGPQEIKYKSLSNRFYFLRFENVNENAILRSETLLLEQSITTYPAARFFMTLYKDFVPKYYSNIKLLLNDFRLHKMKIALNCIDIHNLDFDKIYYFEQEQNYYIINKINYESGRISSAEMYRVKQTIADYCQDFKANDDSIEIESGETRIINVIANDIYPIGTLTITIVTQPLYGTAVVNNDNTITYTHNGIDNVNDSFEYKLDNGTCKDIGLVSIDVNEFSGCYKLATARYEANPNQQDSVFMNTRLCQTNELLEIELFHLIEVNPNICIKYTPNFGLILDVQITESQIQQSIINNSTIIRNVIENNSFKGVLTLTFTNCN